LIGCLQLAQRGLLSFICACALFACALFSLVISRAASAKLYWLHAALTAGFGEKGEEAIR